MSFLSSKFTLSSYSGGSFSNEREYADYLLTSFKNAFLDVNSNWELYSGIETLGSYSGTAYGLRTLQLHNVSTGKYVRIWAFSGSVSTSIEDTPGVNTSTGLKCYKGNVYKMNSSSSANYGVGWENAEILFGVSSSAIDADFAKDLALSIPLFSLYTTSSYLMSGIALSSTSSGIHAYGATINLISDGSMFGTLVVRQSYTQAMLYADDMFLCANQDDSETAGVVASRDQTRNFNFGSDGTPGSASENVLFIFNNADGSSDFSGLNQSSDNGKSRLISCENSGKIVTAPLAVYVYPYTYSGSSSDAVAGGVCLKGWLNPEYTRNASTIALQYSSKGTKYANGRWLCVDAGTMICWDDSNSNPFEP